MYNINKILGNRLTDMHRALAECTCYYWNFINSLTSKTDGGSLANVDPMKLENVTFISLFQHKHYATSITNQRINNKMKPSRYRGLFWFV